MEMIYIKTTDMLEMAGIEERAPRNWVQERKWRKHSNRSEISPSHIEINEVIKNQVKTSEISPDTTKILKRSSEHDTSGETSHKNQCKTGYADESDNDMDFETDIPR